MSKQISFVNPTFYLLHDAYMYVAVPISPISSHAAKHMAWVIHRRAGLSFMGKQSKRSPDMQPSWSNM